MLGSGENRGTSVGMGVDDERFMERDCCVRGEVRSLFGEDWATNAVDQGNRIARILRDLKLAFQAACFDRYEFLCGQQREHHNKDNGETKWCSAEKAICRGAFSHIVPLLAQYGSKQHSCQVGEDIKQYDIMGVSHSYRPGVSTKLSRIKRQDSLVCRNLSTRCDRRGARIFPLRRED